MKKNLLLKTTALITLVIFLFTSCSKKTPEHTNVIPKNAALVMSLNSQKLSDKGEINKFNETRLYKTFMPELKNESKEIAQMFEDIIADPSKSGIDFTKDVYLFTLIDSKKQPTIGYVSALTNQSKLEDNINTLLEKAKAPFKVEEAEGMKYIMQGGRKGFILAWKDNKLLVIVSESNEDLKTLTNNLLNQDKKQSLSSNSSFAEFVAEKKDVNIWMSMAVLKNLSNQQDIEQFDKFGFYSDGNYARVNVEFNEDQIRLTTKAEYSDEFLKNLPLEKFTKNSINKDLFSYIPAKTYMVIGFAINMEEYYNLMKTMPEWNEIEQKVGNLYDLGKIFSSFEGDFVFSITEIKFEEKEVETYTTQLVNDKYIYKDTVYTKQQVMPEMALITKLNNETYANLFITMFSQSSGEKDGSVTKLTIEGNDYYIGLKDKVLIVTNGKNIAAKFEEGGFGSESFANTKRGKDLSGNFAFMYADLNLDNYPKEIVAMMEDEMGGKEFSMFKKFIENFESVTGKAISTSSWGVTVDMKKSGKNSLLTILDLIDSNFEKVMQ